MNYRYWKSEFSGSVYRQLAIFEPDPYLKGWVEVSEAEYLEYCKKMGLSGC